MYYVQCTQFIPMSNSHSHCLEIDLSLSSTDRPAQTDGDRSLVSFHGSISARSIHGKPVID